MDFLSMCAICNVQAVITPYWNPGNAVMTGQIVKFISFNSKLVRVIQQNSKRAVHVIPAKGELMIMLQADEQLPLIEIVKEEE